MLIKYSVENTWVQLSFPGYKLFENMQKKRKKKKTWNWISFSSWNIHVSNGHFEIRYFRGHWKFTGTGLRPGYRSIGRWRKSFVTSYKYVIKVTVLLRPHPLDCNWGPVHMSHFKRAQFDLFFGFILRLHSVIRSWIRLGFFSTRSRQRPWITESQD